MRGGREELCQYGRRELELFCEVGRSVKCIMVVLANKGELTNLEIVSRYIRLSIEYITRKLYNVLLNK